MRIGSVTLHLTIYEQPCTILGTVSEGQRVIPVL